MLTEQFPFLRGYRGDPDMLPVAADEATDMHGREDLSEFLRLLYFAHHIKVSLQQLLACEALPNARNLTLLIDGDRKYNLFFPKWENTLLSVLTRHPEPYHLDGPYTGISVTRRVDDQGAVLRVSRD